MNKNFTLFYIAIFNLSFFPQVNWVLTRNDPGRFLGRLLLSFLVIYGFLIFLRKIAKRYTIEFDRVIEVIALLSFLAVISILPKEIPNIEQIFIVCLGISLIIYFALLIRSRNMFVYSKFSNFLLESAVGDFFINPFSIDIREKNEGKSLCVGIRTNEWKSVSERQLRKLLSALWSDLPSRKGFDLVSLDLSQIKYMDSRILIICKTIKSYQELKKIRSIEYLGIKDSLRAHLT